jgi:hypothetical protein
VAAAAQEKDTASRSSRRRGGAAMGAGRGGLVLALAARVPIVLCSSASVARAQRGMLVRRSAGYLVQFEVRPFLVEREAESTVEANAVTVSALRRVNALIFREGLVASCGNGLFSGCIESCD